MATRRAVRFMKMFIFLIVVISIFAAGFGQAVLHIWNLLMPALFGLHQISYWQALGLLSLCWILFGGPRGWMAPRMYGRNRMRARWEHMTPEERETFRAGMRGRCGQMGSPATESKS